jgi:catechol 2,3-dioxygenase-like lactoylglutathione lyase family enzyme
MAGSALDPLARHAQRTPNRYNCIVIDHVYITVTDLERSRAFYDAVLKSLGWHDLGGYDGSSSSNDLPNLHGFGDQYYGGGVKVGSSIWLRERKAGESGLYVGLVAASPEAVNTAFDTALQSGGSDRGAPGLREYFGPGYYAANILDFDGNELEIVNKSWNPQP